jgi:hypothetical protein
VELGVVSVSVSLVESAADVGIAGGIIPRKNIAGEDYQTWTLFLVCTPTWFVKNARKRLVDLYDQFEAFGHAIGPNNLAVWFIVSRDDTRETVIARRYDASRASLYCTAYGLSPRTAPHVVVTSDYPDLVRPLNSYVSLSLGNADAKATGKLLLAITEQILGSNLSQREIDREARLRRLEQAMRECVGTLGPFFGRMSLQLNWWFIRFRLAPLKPVIKRG